MSRARAYAVARALPALPAVPAVAGGAALLAGPVVGPLDAMTGLPVAGCLSAAGAACVAVTGAVWWARHVADPVTSAGAVRRMVELDRRRHGVAGRLDLAEHVSPVVLRSRAHVLRPTRYRAVSRADRARIDPLELGTLVARTGAGWGGSLWSSHEDHVLDVAPPRSGKTTRLAARVAQVPGALVTTSTRLDLAEMVHRDRSRAGVVRIFNPSGLGGLASSVRWRVLDGCTSWETAARRAADLMPESPSPEGERWDAQGRRVLALLLHAAALSGARMVDLVGWVAALSEATPSPVVLAELSAVLVRRPGGRERAAALRSVWATNDRTRSSITSTLGPVLAWVSDERARPLGDASPGDPALLDLPAFVASRDTLHLIGHEDRSGIAPLLGALVAEIGHVCRVVAADRPGGRLDPPLTMALDEIAQTALVPLDRWTGDMGGRGVALHMATQTLADLRRRWGAEAAEVITANAATVLVGGGSVAPDDLQALSRLVGDVSGDDGTVVPVLSPAQIRSLPTGRVLVLRRGLPPVLASAPSILDRPGWARIDLLDAAPAESAADVQLVTDEPSVTVCDTVTTTTTRPARAGHQS